MRNVYLAINIYLFPNTYVQYMSDIYDYMCMYVCICIYICIETLLYIIFSYICFIICVAPCYRAAVGKFISQIIVINQMFTEYPINLALCHRRGKLCKYQCFQSIYMHEHIHTHIYLCIYFISGSDILSILSYNIKLFSLQTLPFPKIVLNSNGLL